MQDGGCTASLKYAVLADAPIGAAVFDAQSRFVFVNETFAAMDGLRVDAHLGRHPSELFGDAADAWVYYVDEVLAVGSRIAPVRLVGDGAWPPVVINATFYPGPPAADGSPTVVALVRDVSALHRDEQRLRDLADGSRRLAGAGSVDEIVAAAAETGHMLSGTRASLGWVVPQGVELRALAGYPSEISRQWLGQVIPTSSRSLITDAARTGSLQRAEDIDEMLGRHDDQYADAIRNSGLNAQVAFPITSNRRLTAVLNLGRADGRPLSSGFVESGRTLATLVGVALERLERVEADELRRLRAALDAMLHDVIIGEAIRDETDCVVDFRVRYANESATDAIGRPVATLVGSCFSDLWPGMRDNGMFTLFRRVIETGEPFVDEESAYLDVIENHKVEGWESLKITKLGDGFLAAKRDVTESVRNRREVEQAREQEARDREAVRLLQQFALPIHLPRLAGVELSADHRPCEADLAIGGDWYDAFELPGGRLALVVGDIAGHGRAAAQAMIDLRRFIASQRFADVSPGDVLHRANELFLARGDEVLATCCYAVLEPLEAQLTVASAGHPPPAFAHAAGAELLEVEPGPPLGALPESTYEDVSVQVAAPSTVVLYTDGLVERRGRSLSDGLTRLVQITRDAAHAGAAHTRDAVLGELGVNSEDDLCLIVARIG